MSSQALPSPDVRAITEAHTIVQPVRLHLPWTWPGYVLSTLWFLTSVAAVVSSSDNEPQGISLVMQAGVMIYWLGCVYRLHKVLALATHKRYPTSPSKAVWLSFVPLYSLIWTVKWPNRMARFLKRENPTLQIGCTWPGIVAVVALFLGGAGFGGFLMFAVISYLKSKIKKVLQFEKPVPIISRERLDIALSAGLGAGFGLVLCQAIQEFSAKPRSEMVQELGAITLVSVAIVKFIEPVTEWVRHAFRVQHNENSSAHKTWLFRCAVLLAVAFSSFSHDLLDAHIHKHMNEALRLTFAMLLVSGGITYAWATGALCQPARAGRRGLISGASIALILLLALWSDPAEAARNLSGPAQQAAKGAGPLSVPLFIGNEVTSVRGIAIPLCLWALFGLAGGLAIDRGWRKGSVTGIVLSVLLSASLVISILRFTGSVNSTEIALGASAILGWCMTLLLFPSARTILRKQECPG